MSTIDKPLAAGITGLLEIAVGEGDTAIARGSGDLPVLSTIALLGWMEQAAYRSVAPYLAPGQHTVGTSLDVRHLSASPVGAAVTVTTRLASVEGRQLTFQVSARDNAGEIAAGIHLRAIVDGKRFMEKANRKLS